MSADRQYLRLKKLTDKDIVRIAAKHNLREIQAEIGAASRIDPARSKLNQVIAGPVNAADVAADSERLMRDAGVGNLRKDAVRAVEIIVSLPTSSSIDPAAFFRDALAWVRSFFSVHVLSAVIHFDEATPHCHVLLLPLVKGRMVGSDLVGYKASLEAMQASFFEQVGREYGLTRPKAQRRLNQAERGKVASLIVSTIQGSPELLADPDLEGALLETVGRDPGPFLNALRLRLPEKKSSKTFVGIMTKPCKTEKPIGFKGTTNPTGIIPAGPDNNQTLSCVGFDHPDNVSFSADWKIVGLRHAAQPPPLAIFRANQRRRFKE